MPWLLGGSADLANSCLTTLKDAEAGGIQVLQSQEILGSLVSPLRTFRGNTPEMPQHHFDHFDGNHRLRIFGAVSEGLHRHRSHFS